MLQKDKLFSEFCSYPHLLCLCEWTPTRYLIINGKEKVGYHPFYDSSFTTAIVESGKSAAPNHTRLRVVCSDIHFYVTSLEVNRSE